MKCTIKKSNGDYSQHEENEQLFMQCLQQMQSKKHTITVTLLWNTASTLMLETNNFKLLNGWL